MPNKHMSPVWVDATHCSQLLDAQTESRLKCTLKKKKKSYIVVPRTHETERGWAGISIQPSQLIGIHYSEPRSRPQNPGAISARWRDVDEDDFEVQMILLPYCATRPHGSVQLCSKFAFPPAPQCFFCSNYRTSQCRRGDY